MTASLLTKRCLIAGTIFCTLPTLAEDAAPSLALTFNRTGTDAASVIVNTTGIDGVTASLTSVSPTPLAAFGSTALCPQVNGNTSPTIVYEFSIAGLPSDFTFNQVNLKTHAFNASGANQQSSDGKKRHYNLSIDVNSVAVASMTDMDIAANNVNGLKNWEISSTASVTSTDPLTLIMTVTKGTENLGCFFGIEEISLCSRPESGTEPIDPIDPIDPSGAKVYTISWQTGNSLYMTPTTGGGIQVSSYSPNKMQFWELIPTENENCFYIRNTGSGQYIGSCNMEPNAASKVQMSNTPIEYYVGRTSGTDALIAGCYWLSSTDCPNHSNENNNARALNKDGASSNVITWTNGTGKVGSYWTLTETGNLYEPQPFVPSAEVGNPQGIYHLIDAEGRSFTAEGTWEKVAETESHRWYFVGRNNASGGYQIVAAKGHSPINEGQSYTIASAPGGQLYKFLNGETTLELDGVSEFAITPARSEFALKNRIYNMPCGSMGNLFITKVSIGEEFHYPMAVVSGSSVTYPAASKPGNKYVILSKDAAMVMKNAENPLTINLNSTPATNVTITLFIDWDQDGVFEYAQPLSATQTITTDINVPDDAPTGITRARIRLTDNGLNGAEDEVHGEVLDLRLNVTSYLSELCVPTVSVNDPTRGEASWSDDIATASPKGNALFLYWKDGVRVASTSAAYEVRPSSTDRHLTAIFSPNTKLDEEESALAAIELKTGRIIVNGSTLNVAVDSEVKRILVYALNGNLVASNAGVNSLTVNLPSGIYIAKAITAAGTITSKIQL
ncbi:MAG: T9SS type A sorting domain-containing protein [Muribaculaceae bacterium]|nr:T9SS type A sorting domain-containing protein [Muribaculaceae bacterium]